MKKVILGIICGALALSLVACNSNNDKNQDDDHVDDSTSDVIVDNNQNKLETNNKYADVEKNPIVTMEMESGDIIKIELYPKIAPTTVENFIELIEKGFYDGLTFHRLIPEFMAQGGDPLGNGMGGPGYTIKGEFKDNNFKNELKHDIGVISMARTNDKNGAGSQFFIVTNENSYLSLDGLYAGFGKVIEGMENVYKIVNTEVIRRQPDEEVIKAYNDIYIKIHRGEEITKDEEKIINKFYEQQAEIDKPKNPPTIKKMTVETFGVNYDEAEKIK